jgi:hypothetical protein
MAVEPFADQALHDATRRRFISERDLGLDDCVQSGVQLFIRQADAGAAVIVPHEFNTLVLIQLQPFFPGRALQGDRTAQVISAMRTEAELGSRLRGLNPSRGA